MSKKIVKKVIIFIVVMCFCWGLFLLIYRFLNKKNMDKRNMKVNTFDFICQIDEINVKKNKMQMSGFGFWLGKDTSKKNCEVFLWDSMEKEIVYPRKVKYISRNDVNHYFMSENDYTESGFEVTYKANDISSRLFEVLIRFKGEKEVYRTGIYINQGKIVWVYPSNIINLEQENKRFKEILNDGVQLMGRKDIGFFIFQKENYLYWILKKEYKYFNETSAQIECQVNTTQPERLPRKRLEQGYKSDNLAFDFEEKEIKEDFGDYRIAVLELPDEYSITRMATGYYEKNWKWYQAFRINYRGIIK